MGWRLAWQHSCLSRNPDTLEMHGLWRWHSATLPLSRHQVTMKVRTQLLRVGLGMWFTGFVLVRLVWYVCVCVGELWVIMGRRFAWDDVVKSLLCILIWVKAVRDVGAESEGAALSRNWEVWAWTLCRGEGVGEWVLYYYDLYDTAVLKLGNILFLRLICILLKSWSLFRLLISLSQVSWWQTLFFQLLRLTPWNLYWLLFSHNSYLFIRDPAVSLSASHHTRAITLVVVASSSNLDYFNS